MYMYIQVSRVFHFHFGCRQLLVAASPNTRWYQIVATVNLRCAAACDILGVATVGATVLCCKLRDRLNLNETRLLLLG